MHKSLIMLNRQMFFNVWVFMHLQIREGLHVISIVLVTANLE